MGPSSAPLGYLFATLGAARTANPERESSSLSFYFVQRGPRPDSLIEVDLERINGRLKYNDFINDPENKNYKDSLIALEESENWESLYALSDTLTKMAESGEREKQPLE